MLSDLKIRKLMAGDKLKKFADERGLYLVVTPAGGKLFRFDYRFGGKRKTLSLGRYPDVKLVAARARRDTARELLAEGVDPAAIKAEAKVADRHTIDALAREWYADRAPAWSKKHQARMWSIIEKNLPMIGSISIIDLTAEQIEQTIRACQLRSNEIATRLQTLLRGVYDIAIRRDIVRYSPMQAMRHVVPPITYNHHPAPTDPQRVGELMRCIDSYNGGYITACALKLAPRLFCRPGELRRMEWAEIDLAQKRWVIPAAKMKQSEELIIPLARQCIEVLQQIKPLTGHGKYVFPSIRANIRPMSDATINAALRRMGWEQSEITGHGFRAMARTMLDEILRFNPDAIEAQLAHQVADRLGRAYNRTRHLDERVRMMQEWANYLERLKTAT